jgi:hypothetical protein
MWNNRRGREGGSDGRARALIAMSLVGLVGLLVVSTIDSLTRGDGYDLVDHWISLLALGSRAPLGTTTLAVSGILVVGGSVGFAKTMTGSPAGVWFPRVLALLGLCFIGAAVFPVDPVSTYPRGTVVTTTPSMDARLHAFFGIAVLGCLCGLGALAVRWSCARPRFRRFARSCTLACAAAVATSMALVGAKGGQRWDAAFAGLFQRLAMVSITLLVCAVAVQLLSARQPAPLSVPDRTAPPSRAPG